MNWSPAMRESRRSRLHQGDMLDHQVLSYELFGDRDHDHVILANRMMVTRRAHACVMCGETIPPKTRVRAQSEASRDERRTMRFYVCVPCCDAIANRDNDAGAAIEQRWALGSGAQA